MVVPETGIQDQEELPSQTQEEQVDTVLSNLYEKLQRDQKIMDDIFNRDKNQNENDISNLDEKIEKINDDISNLSEKIRDNENKKDALSGRLPEVQSDNAALEQKIEDLKNEDKTNKEQLEDDILYKNDIIKQVEQAIAILKGIKVPGKEEEEPEHGIIQQQEIIQQPQDQQNQFSVPYEEIQAPQTGIEIEEEYPQEPEDIPGQQQLQQLQDQKQNQKQQQQQKQQQKQNQKQKEKEKEKEKKKKFIPLNKKWKQKDLYESQEQQEPQEPQEPIQQEQEKKEEEEEEDDGRLHWKFNTPFGKFGASMSKKNPLARFFSFMQKKRPIKDVGLAIELLEQIIAELKNEIKEEKDQLNHSDLEDEIKAYEEKLNESYEIAEQLKNDLNDLDQTISNDQKELEKLNDNVESFNEERKDKNKLDEGRFERYMKDKNIRTKQENIIDDIKSIYNNDILPLADSFPDEVNKIGDATNALKN